jgi:hypothetical protein
MNKYEIWVEGFRENGGSGTANFRGTSVGTDFRDAVVRWYNADPERLINFNEEKLTDWGCSIFPSQEQAMRSFG